MDNVKPDAEFPPAKAINVTQYDYTKARATWQRKTRVCVVPNRLWTVVFADKRPVKGAFIDTFTHAKI